VWGDFFEAKEASARGFGIARHCVESREIAIFKELWLPERGWTSGPAAALTMNQ